MTHPEEFDYVVARPWSEQDPTLCIYHFHSDVHHGTMEDAEQFLAYVKNKYPDEDYRIYKVTFQVLETTP